MLITRNKKLTLGLTLVLAITASVIGTSSIPAAASPTAGSVYKEPFRPQYHFSPAQNWMNDPNGLVYYQGEYHLFYQYNPFGNRWGNMSWGHAVSRDLVHWSELGVAIPKDEQQDIFSGSAVIDHNNTTGFGTSDHPAMVAIYTSTRNGKQSQALAYSTDGGRTFTKYEGNPVLDIDSREFRDPKVFWYEEGQEWIMSVVLADKRQVSFYSSPDLKQWKHLSDFGPGGAIGGFWECPDLFPLADPNNPGKQKWVLLVSLNPGGIAGGSGTQYFIGDFDGTTFTADPSAADGLPHSPSSGRALGHFDNGSFDGWSVTGSAFGDAPATGTLPGQQLVFGWSGAGYINGFHGFDGPVGTLTSPEFTIDKNYLNFLVGGGNHPYIPGSVVNGTSPQGTIFADFDGSTFGEGWTASGNLADKGPVSGTLPGQNPVSGHIGAGLVNTFFNGDSAVGTISSPSFTINQPFINLLVGGGNHPYGSEHPTSVNLIIDDNVVMTTTGRNSEALNWESWDVNEYQGLTARIEIADHHSGSWGHILADQIMFSDKAASPWAEDTSVKLIVDGQVVRATTGGDSEALDWTSWDVSDLTGRTAHVELSDNNSGGWGHILADQFTLADAPMEPSVKRANWLDYGKDNYAGITYNNVPGGKRILIGWMNNWQYAGDIPTSPWRSAMTVPRELRLRSDNGTLKLVQEPIERLNQLRRGPAIHLKKYALEEGTSPTLAHGKSVEIEAALTAGTANTFGLKVHAGSGQETIIGYDQTTGELYIDRTRSGQVGFNPQFSGVHRAPLALKDGQIKLKILVDWSSVEVFADDGRVVITDQVFADPDSDGISAFAEGGRAELRSFTVHPLSSSWK